MDSFFPIKSSIASEHRQHSKVIQQACLHKSFAWILQINISCSTKDYFIVKYLAWSIQKMIRDWCVIVVAFRGGLRSCDWEWGLKKRKRNIVVVVVILVEMGELLGRRFDNDDCKRQGWMWWYAIIEWIQVGVIVWCESENEAGLMIVFAVVLETLYWFQCQWIW